MTNVVSVGLAKCFIRFPFLHICSFNFCTGDPLVKSDLVVSLTLKYNIIWNACLQFGRLMLNWSLQHIHLKNKTLHTLNDEDPEPLDIFSWNPYLILFGRLSPGLKLSSALLSVTEDQYHSMLDIHCKKNILLHMIVYFSMKWISDPFLILKGYWTP